VKYLSFLHGENKYHYAGKTMNNEFQEIVFIAEEHLYRGDLTHACAVQPSDSEQPPTTRQASLSLKHTRCGDTSNRCQIKVSVSPLYTTAFR